MVFASILSRHSQALVLAAHSPHRTCLQQGAPATPDGQSVGTSGMTSVGMQFPERRASSESGSGPRSPPLPVRHLDYNLDGDAFW